MSFQWVHRQVASVEIEMTSRQHRFSSRIRPSILNYIQQKSATDSITMHVTIDAVDFDRLCVVEDKL